MMTHYETNIQPKYRHIVFVSLQWISIEFYSSISFCQRQPDTKFVNIIHHGISELEIKIKYFSFNNLAYQTAHKLIY